MAAVTPSVRINTFIQGKRNRRLVDHISKVFIVCETLMGNNRFPVMGFSNSVFNYLSVLYVCFLHCTCIYIITYYEQVGQSYFFIKCAQFILSCLLGFVFWKRLRLYYDELEKFDTEMGEIPKISSASIIIVLNTVALTSVLVYMLAVELSFASIPTYVMHTFENNYIAYLLNLLIQRLRLMNKYVASETRKQKDDVKTRSLPMTKLIELYHIVINAYDLLIEAIKWQFLVMLTTSFSYLLMKSYFIALDYINTNIPFMDTITDIVFTFTEMIPLLAPCMCCDLVRAEVHHLRELLASKLYENRIDKPSRSIARALLALTETRNLSFSLLRMIDISISLPFTFLGLLVTYLIIMLQFQKVITPNSSHNATHQ